MVGEIADRRLGQAGDDGKDGQREAKLDIADAELRFEERKQHRQHEHMEMADPMRRRNRRASVRSEAVGLCLLRCGENVDHFGFNPVALRPGRAGETIGQAGYLSMNAAAWQPSRTASKFGDAVNSRQCMAGVQHSRSRMQPLRVLVSEGSSTSAREAITILGLGGGHIVEVCDPSPWCLARFSRFVRKFHRCPGLRDDPAGYLAFVEELLGGAALRRAAADP